MPRQTHTRDILPLAGILRAGISMNEGRREGGGAVWESESEGMEREDVER